MRETSRKNVMYCVYQNIEDNTGFMSEEGLEEDLCYAKFFSSREEAIREGKEAYTELGEDWDELFDYNFVCVLPVRVALPKDFGGVR